MSILDKLDSYYNSRKPREVWMMVGLLATLSGYLLYTTIEPISTEYRERQEGKRRTLLKSIESSKSFLKSITVNGDREYYVKKYNKEIVKKKMTLNSYRRKMAKLDDALKNLQEILYTKDNWSKFLHGIVLKAKDNGLKVSSITNSKVKSEKSFGKVLDINVKAEGDYPNILAFINDVEQTELVTNLSLLSIKATDNKPVADINFSVWGIKR
jgi:Tfp pilus assembly protein PilO